MRILGIDYGKRKIGLAIGVSGFSEPLKVIRYKDIKLLVQEINEIIKNGHIDKVVVGISEGEMARESKEFAEKIGAETYDETLSTKDAIKMSIEAGINRKKRKNMEDAYAATLMLQNYLDTNILK